MTTSSTSLASRPPSVWSRILRNLRRPLPELAGYVAAKVLSRIWRAYLQRAGAGLHISMGARIKGGRSISVGDRFYAGPSLWMEAVHQYQDARYSPVIEIGSNVSCSDFVHIACTTRVTIHDGVLMGSRVHITDHSHGRYSGHAQDPPGIPPVRRVLSRGRPVTIGRNVWLGDGVVVLPGVTIGEGSVVGANSVVTHDLPAQVIAVGSPAVVIKAYDDATARWLPISSPK